MVTAGVAAGGAHYGTREAEAIAPVVIGGGLAISAAVGWAVREYEIIGADGQAEGLTLSALASDVYQTALTRKSTNASTFIDNNNIMNGAEHVAYTDSKADAIGALNDGLSESEVQAAATDTNDAHFTTVLKNLLKSWNESVNELYTYLSALLDHPDTSGNLSIANNDEITIAFEEAANRLDGYTEGDVAYTLPDGTDFTVLTPTLESGTDTATLNPVSNDATSYSLWFAVDSSDRKQYLKEDDWFSKVSEIETAHSNVNDGLITWVDSVYSDVQSGEIDLTDLVTPSQRASMMSDDETIAPAIADLIALNKHVDPNREATITLEDDNITLIGTFARTDSPEGEPLEAGTTYDPGADLTGDVYFTYDTAGGQGVWNDYQTGVDGGTITFTSEPHGEVEYHVDTTAGETATVLGSAFSYDETDDVYRTDISSQVENTITEIDSVTFVMPEDAETAYETIVLSQPFTIDKFVNDDGEEVTAATFEQNGAPQDDTNYITQAEWDDLAAKNEELIEKYENAQGGGGALFGGSGIPNIGIVAIVAGAAALLLGSNN